jgi:hypothetical protein
MSMAKRQQDLLFKGEKERREAFLAWAKTDEGQQARAWVEEQEKKDMAEQLKVMAEGEHIIVGTEGEHVLLILESKDAKVEIRFTFAEAEQFEEAFDKMRKRVGRRIEARRSREAMKVDRVEEDDEDADG